MPSYIAFWSTGDRPRMETLIQTVRTRHPNLIRHDGLNGTVLLMRGGHHRRSLQSNTAGSLLVMGQLFERGPGRTAPSLASDIGGLNGNARDMARALIDDHWGSYLAIMRCPQTARLWILRDPSGSVPVTMIGDSGLGLAADQIPRWLFESVSGRPSHDWSAVAEQLKDPTTSSRLSLLDDASVVVAGTLQSADRTDRPSLIWQPSHIVERPRPDADRLAAHLDYTVRDAVSALVRADDKPLLELSGGLDSTILLGCLTTARTGTAPPCLNLSTVQASGDERRYARAAAELHQARLTAVVVQANQMDYARLVDQSANCEPLLFGADVAHEAHVVEQAALEGASAILTGQGGDAVFFQEPTPLVAADHILARGHNRESWRSVMDCADRSYGSVWSVLAATRTARHGPRSHPLIEHDGALLGTAIRSASRTVHPWLADASRLPPGKALQLQLLAACQFFNGPTSRNDHRPLLHPLLAQPIAELALAVPTWQLAYGRQDRALARAAFDAILPDIVKRRRGKGEVSSYYSRAILANLGLFREMLIDGVLTDRGLLDRDALDRSLTERSLLQRPDHRVLVGYLSLECWLRSWS